MDGLVEQGVYFLPVRCKLLFFCLELCCVGPDRSCRGGHVWRVVGVRYGNVVQIREACY